MKKALQKLFTLFKKADSSRRKKARKTWGQSMVEFAIALPVLILLFSGMIELGFILNTYLSLLDATRESARFYSNLDPFGPDPDESLNRPSPDWFFTDSSSMVRAYMDPSLVDVNYQGRRLVLDPAMDDVIITVYGIDNTNNSVVTTGPYRVYSHEISAFTGADIQSQMITGSPNAGILVVEVIYSYEQIMGLPWTAFMGDHIMLRAHTMMPLNAAEP